MLRSPWIPLIAVLAFGACSAADASTTDASTDTTGAAATDTSDPTGMGTSTETPTGTGAALTSSGTSAGTTGEATGTSTGDTGASSGGDSSGAASSTGDAGTGDPSSTGEASTGGGVVASFSCVETTPVELALKETISGSFLGDGTPVDLSAVMVKGGAIDFHVDVALPVDPNDPNAADIAAFEAFLTMQAWDVNINDMSDDRRYFFAPEGAQNVAIFPAFYYKVYGGGGNGQFEFDCKTQ